MRENKQALFSIPEDMFSVKCNHSLPGSTKYYEIKFRMDEKNGNH